MIRELTFSLLAAAASVPPWGIGLLLLVGVVPALANAAQRKHDGVQEWSVTHATTEVQP